MENKYQQGSIVEDEKDVQIKKLQHNLEAQTATVLELNNGLKKLKDTQKEMQNSL